MSAASSITEGLRVLIADEDKQALERLGSVIRELGHEVIARAVGVAEVARDIAEEQPDIAMVKLHEDDEHALDLIEEIVEDGVCPVIALMEAERTEFIAQAAQRGIYAYVQPLREDSVQGAIEIAMRRHADQEALSEEVDQLETALGRRSIIERAKGILMERHSVDDGEAFELLRHHARSNSRKVVDVARAVAEGHLLPPRE